MSRSCQLLQLASISKLTLSPPNKLSSAIFLICSNFQSASMLLKVGENVVLVSNRLGPDETQSFSASHPHSSCLNMAIVIMIGGLRVNPLNALIQNGFFDIYISMDISENLT